jgi:hypothetical protein
MTSPAIGAIGLQDRSRWGKAGQLMADARQSRAIHADRVELHGAPAQLDDVAETAQIHKVPQRWEPAIGLPAEQTADRFPKRACPARI